MREKTIFITGGAKRIGASIANYFHAKNFKIFIHYNKSKEEVNKLSQELNEKENGSCKILQADFSLKDSVSNTIEQFYSLSDRIDVLVNNASSFYPTPIQESSEEQWKNLLDTNATTPLFLIQGFQKGLQESGGSVINISDSLASKGIKNYSLYSSAKGALETLTKSLAKELAPEIRINAVAPGAILWPEDEEINEETKNSILEKVDLRRIGDPKDIASAVYFLTQASYITGQVLKVDGGRSVI
jgi:pteridine reductase